MPKAKKATPSKPKRTPPVDQMLQEISDSLSDLGDAQIKAMWLAMQESRL